MNGVSNLRVVLAIAKAGFLEILKDKILYNIIVFSALMLGLSVLASHLTFIQPSRVILDFGLSAVNISLSLVSVFFGASMLAREFERRTVYVTLSRPVSRLQFIFGKFTGLSGVVFLNWVLFCISFLGIYAFSSAEPISLTLLMALFLVFIQCLLLIALAMAFSAFSTTSLSVMMVVGIYIVGANVSQIQAAALRVKSIPGKLALQWVSNLVPNFEHFHWGFKVTYGIPVPTTLAIHAVLYGLGYSVVALLCAGLLVRTKEK